MKLCEFARTHKELAAKLNQLEHTVSGHNDAISQLVATIRQLMVPPPEPKRRKIGFHRDDES